MKMLYFKTVTSIRNYLLAFLRWLVLGLVVGGIGGSVGALFSKAIGYVTETREQNPWVLLLLPVGGLLSVAVYKLFRITGVGTNAVLESVRSEKKVPYLLAPAVFLGTCLTHLLGGSAGREGAALQLGGSVASLLGGALRLNEKTRHILAMCGMGALFSALFGTPIGACIFALEVVNVGHFCSAAFFPSLVSSVSAYVIALKLGAHAERFTIAEEPSLNVDTIWRVVVIAIACAVVSFFFCHIMHTAEHFFKKTFPNEFLRVMAGSLLIIALTFVFGTDYNGGGISVIERIFEGDGVHYEAFLLKILFTAITIGVGFKGGEIVPTLFIGATLGATVGMLLGLDLGIAAAVGMVALFCGVTNCPLASIVLSVELFDGKGFVFCSIACVISFLLSGNASLYTGQRLIYSKLNDEEININAG